MNDLFAIAAHNTLVSLVLALFVYGLTRVWNNPPVAHVLWLLVLLKLIAPPVMRVDLLAFQPHSSTYNDNNPNVVAEQDAAQSVTRESRPLGDQFGAHRKGRLNSEHAIDGASAQTSVSKAMTSEHSVSYAATLSAVWIWARPILFSLWLGGAAVCGLISAIRILRFERLLRDTLPAPERWQRLTQQVADRIGLRRMPQVCYVDCVDIPMVWCAGGRPKLVLPMGLLKQLDDRAATMVLSHELAHLRRRDHWVRGIEMVVAILYWWNPLVGVIRQQIHQVEDVCCDAWVRWMFPDSEKCYAETVLKTAELLSVQHVNARLLPTSPFFHTLSLKERIEMILKGRFAPRISTGSACFIAFFALMLWPSFMPTTKTEARADSNDSAAAPTEKADTATPSEFPHVVKFEQGATRFLEGDKITILEIRGTAETFTQGNLYWIKGTYSLTSHDKAQLAAYITATEAVNATGPYLKVQTAIVNRGEGAFTLFLPMSYKGLPHVSFYPANGGEGFGGNYFGTGDSVLKEWWGSKDDELIQEIEKLGGRIERAESPSGAIVGIDFGGSHVLNDEDINRLQSFKSLTTVGLGHTRITDAGLAHLAELEKIRKLTKLYLRSATMSEAGAKASKELKELTTLYIDNTQISDAGVMALKSMQRLTTLGLGHTQTSDSGLKAVVQLTDLTHLYIDNTKITDSGVQTLKSLQKLTTLGLGHTQTSDAGLKTVGQLTGLTHLYIDNTPITDAGLEELRNLKNLHTLGLGHTQITDAGLKSLREMKNLTTLYVDHTQVTDAGVQELSKSLPNVNINR